MGDPDRTAPHDPDEAEGLKDDTVVARGELDRLEQASLCAGKRWLDRQKDPDVLSEAFVCRLRKELFGGVWEWAGTFRKTETNLGVDPRRIGARLRRLLDDAGYWVGHGIYPSKELAARFHLRLVQIHPFPNGNGRRTRILTDALLTRLLGEPTIDWEGGRGPERGDARRMEYIDALRAADEGDFSALLRFVGQRDGGTE